MRSGHKKEKRPWLTLPNQTGSTTALELLAHLNPSEAPRATSVREILSPS